MKHQTDEIERLILDYLKGCSTLQDRQKLSLLQKEDPTFKEKYGEIVRAYALASTSLFAQNREINLEQLRSTLNFRSSRKRTFSRKVWIYSNVAIFILLFGLSYLFLYQPPPAVPIETSYCEVENQQKGISKLSLPDGTVVHLNERTVLKYDASLQHRTKREVFLTGEAYFEVAGNVDKPFVVHTEGLDIKVLGTTFNVSSYPDSPEIKVSLAEGSVKVSMPTTMHKEIVLSPNEQAVYNKADKLLSMKKINASTQSAWTTGKMAFVNEKLSDILKKIEKQYGVQILVKSQKVHTEYYSGSIDTSLSLDRILSYIDVDNKFTWNKKGKIITVTDKR